MDNIKEFYSKNLTELKPHLPANYIEELHKVLNHIPKHRIRDAFLGKVADENILRQIFTEAHFQARRRINEKKKVERQIREIKSGTTKVAAFFLPLLGNFLQ